MTRTTYDALVAHIADYGSTLVAYSGGIDSTLVAVAARDALGDRYRAVLVDSDLAPSCDAPEARAVAEALGIRLEVVTAQLLTDPAVAANPTDRCYHCKRTLLSSMRSLADGWGLDKLADGTNADDAGDYRPGKRALAEFGVKSPLTELGITKADIRSMAAELGLPNADRPSMACLASRFVFGDTLTAEGLARVDAAEAALRALGLRQARVRAHGDAARVEVAPEELEAAWNGRAEIAAAVREAGFTWASLDLDGYRTGSLNEALRD